MRNHHYGVGLSSPKDSGHNILDLDTMWDDHKEYSLFLLRWILWFTFARKDRKFESPYSSTKAKIRDKMKLTTLACSAYAQSG